MPSACKLLFIVRHAKSSWKDEILSDRDRPLNKRGRRDAPVMAKRLVERGERPELIVSSPAVRALTTARIFASELGTAEDDVLIDEGIYAAAPETLLDVIRGVDESATRVMIVGHNPGLTDFVNALAGCDIDNVPTSGVVVVRCESVRWQDVKFGIGELMGFDFPKNVT